MAYCVPLGIPHSKFLDWDPMDQDKALAFQRDKNSTCRCGTKPREWAKDRFAYVGQQRHCPGCELLEQERENVPEAMTRSTHVYLVPPDQAKTPEDEGVVT